MTVIFVTHCCESKAPIAFGNPRQLYQDIPGQHRLEPFWTLRDDFGEQIIAAILSLKYGLVFENEVIDNYNLAAEDVKYHQRVQLGQMVKEKAKGTRILYYAKHILTSKPFIEILGYSNIPHMVVYRIEDTRRYLQFFLENQFCPVCKEALEHLGEDVFVCWEDEIDFLYSKGVLVKRPPVIPVRS